MNLSDQVIMFSRDAGWSVFERRSWARTQWKKFWGLIIQDTLGQFYGLPMEESLIWVMWLVLRSHNWVGVP